jgi:hypothetical protein
MGVVGLLRTSPARNTQPYMGFHDEDPRLQYRDGASEPGLAARAGELADVVKDKIQDWSAEAGHAARATATQVAETTTAMAERASRALRDARDVARDTAGNVGERATAVAERASDGLHDVKSTARITGVGVGDKAAAVAGQASQAVQDASDTVRETVAHMADRAAVLGQQASVRLYDAMPDRQHRDTYLLGAAALAVAAAVGVAYQRRSHHAESADDRR